MEANAMIGSKQSVLISLSACALATLLITLGVILGPWLVEIWFHLYRGWEIGGEAMQRITRLFCACFYPSSVFAYLTLYHLTRLLWNILKERVFVSSNVVHLRYISWSCIAVSLITLAGGVFYLPFCFIAVAAGFVGLMLRIVKNVMQSAVEIREENELTI